jgi:WD40 repeat protein/DNA-binding XRE family transcriptional regulator
MPKEPASAKFSSATPFWSQQIFSERIARGWSQGDLANKTGADTKSVSRWENGDSFPQPIYRQKIAEVFQKKPEDLGFTQELQMRNNIRQNGPDHTEEERSSEFDLPRTAPANDVLFANDLPTPTPPTTTIPHNTGHTRKRAWWKHPMIILCAVFLIVASSGGLIYIGALKQYIASSQQSTKQPGQGPLHYLYSLGPDIQANAVAWSPDGKYLVSANGNGTAWVFDASHNSTWLVYTHHTNFVNAVAWAPDKSMRVASASADGTVQVWNGVLGNRLLTYRGHSASVWAVAWSPNGTEIASGGHDTSVQVWNASTGAKLFTYRGHTKGVEAIAWSPDGTEIASAGNDGTVQIWNSSTGTPIYTYRGHTGMVYDLSWAPNGQRIASASADGTVQVWNAINGGDVLTYRGHSPLPVQAVKWSPNGKFIASGSLDKTVQVWNASTGRLITVYHGHLSGIYSVAWSPNDQFIASASSDGTIRVWNFPGM